MPKQNTKEEHNCENEIESNMSVPYCRICKKDLQYDEYEWEGRKRCGAKPFDVDTKEVIEEFEVNWKAIIIEKLYDAQVRPDTIVMIMERFEKLMSHKTAKAVKEREEEILEIIKKVSLENDNLTEFGNGWEKAISKIKNLINKEDE